MSKIEFSDKAVESILLYTDIMEYYSEQYTQRLRKEAIEAFEDLLNMSDIIYSDAKQTSLGPEYITELNNFFAKSTPLDWDDSLNMVEPFLKRLFKLTRGDEYNDPNRENWTLIPLYQKFGVPTYKSQDNYVDFNEPDWRSKTGVDSFWGFYMVAWQSRNLEGHGEQYTEVSLDEIEDPENLSLRNNLAKIYLEKPALKPNALDILMSVLCVYLHVLCQEFTDEDGVKCPYYKIVKKEYKRAMNNTNSDALRYCKDVVDEYAKKEAAFVMFPWQHKNENGNSEEVTIDKLVDKKYVKFSGHAGTGKTESLKYIQMILCKQYLAKERENFPVLIELKKLKRDGDGSIINGIDEKLRLYDKAKVKSILSNNGIMLFLDGYNEITNRDRREEIVEEITKIRNQWPDLSVWISDRSEQTEPSCMNDVPTFSLSQLSKEQIKQFIEQYIKCTYGVEAETFEVYNSLFEGGELKKEHEWIIVNASPFLLISIVEIRKSGYSGKITEEMFNYLYIENLLAREKGEKDDKTRGMLLDRILRKVAVYMSQKEDDFSQEVEFISDNELWDIIDSVVGQNGVTSDYIDLIEGLGIMQSETSYFTTIYYFVVDAYADVFLARAEGKRISWDGE